MDWYTIGGIFLIALAGVLVYVAIRTHGGTDDSGED